jgi:hypothetical protein
MVSYGSVDYFLGLLADTGGDADAAERHLRGALEDNRRAGSLQWLARTQVALARRLAAIGTSAALEEAHGLLDAAERTSARLGLTAVSAAAAAVRPTLVRRPLREDGAPVFTFQNRKRFFYIESPAGAGGFEPYSLALESAHRLVSQRGRFVAALDLMHDGKTPMSENGEVVDVGSGGERVDERALAEVRREVARRQDELLVAIETGNDARRAALEEELAVLEPYVANGSDAHGRPRKEPSAADRAYGAVYQRVHRAIEVLRERWPDMAAHLKDALKTGRECIYDPDPAQAPTWILD